MGQNSALPPPSLPFGGDRTERARLVDLVMVRTMRKVKPTGKTRTYLACSGKHRPQAPALPWRLLLAKSNGKLTVWQHPFRAPAKRARAGTLADGRPDR